MTSYIQHQKTADEVVADLDGQITERLARNFGNMTLWHADAATLLRRYREMAGEISTLRAQQETDRATIAALSAPSPSADALRSGGEATHYDTGCVTCGGNGKTWSARLQGYFACEDCSPEQDF